MGGMPFNTRLRVFNRPSCLVGGAGDINGYAGDGLSCMKRKARHPAGWRAEVYSLMTARALRQLLRLTEATCEQFDIPPSSSM